MVVRSILTPQRVKVPLQATAKEDAIRELVDLLADSGDVTDRDEVLKAVLEREQTRTTGIGNGLAVPHGKTSAVPELVMAVGKPAEALDFSSVDGRPVELVILLVSPKDKTGPHIRALARIARMLSVDTVRRKLYGAQTADALYEHFIANEDAGF